MTDHRHAAGVSRMLRLAACAAAMLLAACGSSDPADSPVGQAPGVPGQPDTPPATSRQVVNILAPGQSGFISTTGQAQGSASGNPGDYGEHLDDQRLMYWSSEFKPGEFADVSDMTPVTPRDGVRIYRDAFGVPIIYAETAFDLAFGMGYALSEDRLFLQDGARRQAKGTLAELTGPGTVPADIQARVLTYSEAEYQAMYDALPTTAKDLTDGYVAGANAWIDEVTANPSLLPFEYQLLTTTPEPFTVTDVLAAGVLITRTVASEGGNSFDNVAALRELEALHGTETGRQIFQDVQWQNDAAAAVTVPPAEADFSNITTPAVQRAAAFDAMADYAATLPLELASGPGTGDAPEPSPLPIPTAGAAMPMPAAKQAAQPWGDIIASRLRQTFSKGGGASYMAVVAPERSATGQAVLINGPQLGYAYPTLLMEVEVHGAGFDARGSTAPMLPVVGIGYGERTAWGLTTGNAKTIDSFIETIGADDPNTYVHDGETKPMDCRTETVDYRAATQGVPFGPAAFSEDVEVCRTVHGPIVSRSDDGTLARSVNYAMWGREVETIMGVIDWMRVDTFDAFQAAMAKVTWNENTMYADADGNIAFWHPGLHPRRAAGGDQRLPLPGDGSFDHDGFLDFAETPQIVNPDQGWLANWNNKPAAGWGDGVGGNAISLPAGADQRVTNWFSLLEDDATVSFEDILAMDRDIGLRDPRARAVVPILSDLRAGDALTDRQAALVDAVLAWDGNHHRPDLDITDEQATDGPGATIFDVFVRALRDELFGDVLPPDFFGQMTALGNHEYDVAPLDNLAIRILRPATSSITPGFDYTGGRDNTAVLTAALDRADSQLQTQFGGMEIATYRRVHHRDNINALTGCTTGPCTTMPHQDRGTWIHAVGFE